jgi:hypothetical protein
MAANLITPNKRTKERESGQRRDLKREEKKRGMKKGKESC